MLKPHSQQFFTCGVGLSGWKCSKVSNFSKEEQEQRLEDEEAVAGQLYLGETDQI
jgi:hypothetical protein